VSIKRSIACLIVPAALAAPLHAAIVITNDWESGAETWTDRVSWGTPNTALTNPDATGLGGGSDALRITGGSAGGGSESYVYNNTLTGDYNSLGIVSLSFDFYAASNTPAALELYFRHDSGGAGDTEWHFTISDLYTGWHTYDVNFLTSGGWYNSDYGPGNQTQLLADLVDVDEIGLLLTYQPNVTGQIYGTDNWQAGDTYYIPEPETYAMLAFAFVSLAITFRKNLNEQLERALAAVRASRQS